MERWKAIPLVKLGGRHEKFPGYHWDRINCVHVRDTYDPRRDLSGRLDREIAKLRGGR